MSDMYNATLEIFCFNKSFTISRFHPDKLIRRYIPVQVRNKKLVSIIESSVKKVVLAGKCAGGFVPQSKDDVKWLLNMSIKFSTYNVDCDILYRPANDVVEWFESKI